MENTIIKNTVILDLDLYNSMNKELEDYRKTKYCQISIGTFKDSFYGQGYVNYYLPKTEVEGPDEVKNIVEIILNKIFTEELIIEIQKQKETIRELRKNIETITDDNYFQTFIDTNFLLRKEVEEQNKKIERLEKVDKLNLKLKEQIIILQNKK